MMRSRRGLSAITAALVLTWAAALGANSVTDWSSIAEDSIVGVRGKLPSPSTINMAMVHIAIYDAVNSIEPSGFRNFTDINPTPYPGASVDAAVAAAAHGVLVGMFPEQQEALDTKLADALAVIPDGDAKSGVLLLRANDGRDDTYLYSQPIVPGVWQRTPPAFAAPIGIELSHVTPFAMISPSQFRPGPPPPLRSRRYAADLNEVALIGRDTSSLRNAYQSDTARFLTEHTQRMLNRAFRKLAVERGLSVPDAARLFAMIHAAAADSSIACYEAKYHYNFWRPIQAIPGAEHDNNKRTAADPSWLPFVTTPAHPEYPSSHTCHSAAAMLALRTFFGTDRISFTIDSTVTGTTHSFDRFREFTNEVVEGRIWGGIHYRFSTEEAKKLAEKSTRWMFCNKFRRLDEAAEPCD
jgi:PAP2 superfamily